MKKQLPTLFALVVGLFIFSACSGTPVSNTGESADISVTGIEVVQLGSLRKNGLLQARVQLNNDSSRKISARYRIVWQNAAGDTIEPEFSHWEPVTLQPEAELAITQIAPSAKVVKYRLLVEKAD